MEFLEFKSLLESKKDLKLQLEKGKVSQELFDKITSSIPPKIEKYAGWIGKNWSGEGMSLNHIFDLLVWFERNKAKLKEKDINKYTLDSLQYTFDELGLSRKETELEIKKKGSKLIYEDDNYYLYEIYDHKSSCYYGSGTVWCITSKNKNNQTGNDEQWRRYTRMGSGFMFLIKKNGDIKDKYYKIAIAYYDSDNGKRYILSASDSNGDNIDIKTIKSIFSSIKYRLNLSQYVEYFSGHVPFIILKKEDMLDRIVNGVFTINSDDSVDVVGDVVLFGNRLKTIPIVFGEVIGDFKCHDNNLGSLEGSPHTVGGDFYCYGNSLKSLEGAPKSVDGNFYCYDNKVKFTEEDVRAVSDVKGRIVV